MYPRYITQNVKTALADTPVVFILGPRQCGKTTLVKNLIAADQRTYITLDDQTQFEIAKTDPVGLFLSIFFV